VVSDDLDPFLKRFRPREGVGKGEEEKRRGRGKRARRVFGPFPFLFANGEALFSSSEFAEKVGSESYRLGNFSDV